MELLIYGAGGFGREVAWLASEMGRERRALDEDPMNLLGFIDDHSTGALINDLPVLGLAAAALRYPNASVFVAVGSGPLREKLVGETTDAGLKIAPPLIAPTVRVSEWNRIGYGSCVCEGSIITVNATIGEHVQINLGCTIGHDSILEDYVTLAPGVHVSGWVCLRRGAYVGTGVSIINGTSEKPLVIGQEAVVGAGACVVADVAPRSTVVGVPAKERSGQG